jgi:mRNA-degrading endonuclease RelE of RelBE toxin-antitoxin system
MDPDEIQLDYEALADALAAVNAEAPSGEIKVQSWIFFFDDLKALWDPNYCRPLHRLGRSSLMAAGMTEEFVTDIKNIDRKLQGRILEAITAVLEQPTTVRGDTIRPLDGEFKGLWRYRIGDFRLIYSPDLDNRQVIFVRFAARGSVYD